MVKVPQKNTQSITLSNYSNFCNASSPTLIQHTNDAENTSTDFLDTLQDNIQDTQNIQTFHWKERHVLCLIDAYKKHQNKFKSVNYKSKDIWKKITEDIEHELTKNKEFIVPTKVQVENKWKTIYNRYKKVTDHNNVSGNERKECPFYRELNDLFHNKPNVNPILTISSNGTEKKSDICVGQKRKNTEVTSEDNKTKKKKNFQEQMFLQLKEMREERKQRDENMMAQLAKMHEEQMKMFSSLIVQALSQGSVAKSEFRDQTCTDS